MKVVIWVGRAWEPWNPDNLQTGIGGSEVACINMAKELAKLGCEVVVYGDCYEREGVWEGVRYIDYAKAPTHFDVDVLLVLRQPWALDDRTCRGLKFLWMEDTTIGPSDWLAHERLLRFDRVLCVSSWAREFFLKQYPFMRPDTVIATRNGIDLSRFTQKRPKKKQLIYASCPSRGLDVLLEKIWPRIYAEEPGTELHVYYGFATWNKLLEASIGTTTKELKARVLKLLKQPGVVYHDRCGQQELADAFLESMVWAYPTAWEETSCITAMEAQAGGCVPVTTNLAALTETVQVGYKLPAPNTTQGYHDQFVELILGLLRSHSVKIAMENECYKAAKQLGWDRLALEWMAMFEQVRTEVDLNVVPPFYP